MDSLQLSVFLFIIMFIVSGYNKLIYFKTPSSEATRLANKININLNLSEYIVLFVGLFELFMSLVVIFSIFYDKKYLKYGIYGLMLFTFGATLIFYTSPFKYKPFLSNLSVMTGLYLMLSICDFKIK